LIEDVEREVRAGTRVVHDIWRSSRPASPGSSIRFQSNAITADR